MKHCRDAKQPPPEEHVRYFLSKTFFSARKRLDMKAQGWRALSPGPIVQIHQHYLPCLHHDFSGCSAVMHEAHELQDDDHEQRHMHGGVGCGDNLYHALTLGRLDLLRANYPFRSIDSACILGLSETSMGSVTVLQAWYIFCNYSVNAVIQCGGATEGEVHLPTFIMT